MLAGQFSVFPSRLYSTVKYTQPLVIFLQVQPGLLFNLISPPSSHNSKQSQSLWEYSYTHPFAESCAFYHQTGRPDKSWSFKFPHVTEGSWNRLQPISSPSHTRQVLFNLLTWRSLSVTSQHLMQDQWGLLVGVPSCLLIYRHWNGIAHQYQKCPWWGQIHHNFSSLAPFRKLVSGFDTHDHKIFLHRPIPYSQKM